MKFVKVTPSGGLAAFIDCFWFYQGEAGALLEDQTFPDGCIEIVFNLSTTVRRSTFDGTDSVNPEVEVIGQMTNPYQVRCIGQNKFLGIKFFPHTFSWFSNVPLSEFIDSAIPASDVLGKEFQSIVYEIQDTAEPLQKLALLERFFLKKLAAMNEDKRKLAVLDYSVKSIFGDRENDSLDAILENTGVNARYLQRLFLHRIGVSPKLLLKIARFQKSFQLLKDSTLSLTQIAIECGYYDQAHFNHDFKSLAGMTPSEFLKNEFPINQYFLAEQQNPLLHSMALMRTESVL